MLAELVDQVVGRHLARIAPCHFLPNEDGCHELFCVFFEAEDTTFPSPVD